MKEKIFAFLCLMSLLLSGCYEDKGNYDYNNLLKITITGFLSEKEDAYGVGDHFFDRYSWSGGES